MSCGGGRDLFCHYKKLKNYEENLVNYFLYGEPKAQPLCEGGEWRYAWQPPKEQKVLTVKTNIFRKYIIWKGKGTWVGMAIS